MFILSNKSILDFSKNLLNLPVRIPIDDFLCFATYGCCHPCYLIIHSAFEGALTFVSEPKLGHSAFHYPRLGNFISLFNKI